MSYNTMPYGGQAQPTAVPLLILEMLEQKRGKEGAETDVDNLKEWLAPASIPTQWVHSASATSRYEAT